MKTLTTFIIGTVTGIYVDQNYNIPHIITFVNIAIEWAKKMEENMRK